MLLAKRQKSGLNFNCHILKVIRQSSKVKYPELPVEHSTVQSYIFRLKSESIFAHLASNFRETRNTCRFSDRIKIIRDPSNELNSIE